MASLSIDAITTKDGIYGAERDGARALISFANRFAKTRGFGQRTLLSHPTRWYRPPPMQLEIVTTDRPTDEDRQAVLGLLVEYNARQTGEMPFRQFALLLREPGQAEIVGGLYAYVLYDWLSIELLIVPESHRDHGFGTELIRRAETYATEAGCVGVWLNTFSFQALGFYQKLGYEVFGSLDDYPRGSQRYFLRKRLVPVAQRV
jgi:GNAT superfamily N-acetyltransferase